MKISAYEKKKKKGKEIFIDVQDCDEKSDNVDIIVVDREANRIWTLATISAYGMHRYGGMPDEVGLEKDEFNRMAMSE